MAAITACQSDFEGTDGATASAANIGATVINGAGTRTFSGTDPKQGTTDLQVSTTTSAQVQPSWDFTPVGTFWAVFYLKTPSAAPAANMTFANWVDSSAGNVIVGGVRLNTDMTVSLRDANTSVWTSPSPLATNTWVRIAVKCVANTATGHRCRIYTSSGGNAVTPDMDSGNQTATNAGISTVGAFRLGILSNTASMTLHVDRLRADDATEPAGLTLGNPPTVNAGADTVKDLGSSNFTLTGTATPAAGTTIVSRSWSILSGTTVTLSGQTTDTVTITPPSSGSSTVMRYTATASDGQSATDDVTVTWVTAGQVFRPVGDFATNSWTAFPTSTPISNAIDEVTLDTADYVQSPNGATGQEYKMRLESKPAPGSTSNVYVELVMDITSDVTSQSTVVKLYDSDGTTVRKTFSTITDLTTTPTARTFTLTSGEAAAITGWNSGLVIGVAATVS